MLASKVPLLEICNSSLPSELTDALAILNLPICSVPPAEGYFLSCENGGLVLNTEEGERVQPVLSKPAGFTGKQPLLRALAPARGGTVIDATAGLAGDSLKLAMIADRVIVIERNPVVFALLISALSTARSSSLSLANKIEAHFGDAIELIKQLPAADVIFMDPMFPPKRKRSALPPKSVRILRNIVGDDSDDEELLRVARCYAKRRVVAKRPLHAAPLAEDHVALHEGKVVRYEVYLPMSKQS
ncbi:MAG: class I SAM-dependent methyltransferase [Pseudomonadota bacterium]|nr:class I SAM-dependent methyltransferase [Pseudomonadota bacterium]